MIASTVQIAGDNRPMIEVVSLERHGGALTLTGTAVVYEGTVLVDIVTLDGRILLTVFTTASAGGPMRGAWAATLPLAEAMAELVIRGEEMEEGAGAANQRRIVVAL